MPHPSAWETTAYWTRRHLLKLGLAGVGASGIALALHQRQQSDRSVVKIPLLPTDAVPLADGMNPMTVLRDFDYGTLKQENGRTIREFQIEVGTTIVQLNQAISFVT
jgi:manganese oxidase